MMKTKLQKNGLIIIKRVDGVLSKDIFEIQKSIFREDATWQKPGKDSTVILQGLFSYFKGCL